jgi:hypothetical protein
MRNNPKDCWLMALSRGLRLRAAAPVLLTSKAMNIQPYDSWTSIVDFSDSDHINPAPNTDYNS